MTNCFPQHFVSVEQIPKQQGVPRKIIQGLVALIIIGAILVFLVPLIGLDRPVPTACKNDRGQPVIPIEEEGAWAIILNFNHPESTEETIGCWAIVEETEPVKKVSYRAGIKCKVVHDSNVAPEDHVAIGRGKAAFDGTFHIECPRRNINPKLQLYETFYVHARVRFPEENSSYTILSHDDISVGISFEEQIASRNWKATAISTYGSESFTDTATIETVPDNRFGIQSTVFRGEGTHLINGNPVTPRMGRDVPRFTFDYSEPFVIGDVNSSWTLYNMIIDPPPPNSGFDP